MWTTAVGYRKSGAGLLLIKTSGQQQHDILSVRSNSVFRVNGSWQAFRQSTERPEGMCQGERGRSANSHLTFHSCCLDKMNYASWILPPPPPPLTLILPDQTSLTLNDSCMSFLKLRQHADVYRYTPPSPSLTPEFPLYPWLLLFFFFFLPPPRLLLSKIICGPILILFIRAERSRRWHWQKKKKMHIHTRTKTEKRKRENELRCLPLVPPRQCHSNWKAQW